MSRKANIGRTISYLFKDETKLKKEGQKSITIRKNVRSRKLENVIKEFKANESLRKYHRSDAVKLYHTVLSFHEKDSPFLNEKALKDFAGEYMKQRGENMYIAAAHFDKGHIHLHICESGTGYLTGKANRLSKQEFKELKVAMQTFQQAKYPELKHSLPEHGKGSKPNEKRYTINLRDTQKQTLLDCLKQAEFNSKNTNEFISQIKQSGHEPYYRGGRLTGIKYDGDTKFRLSRLGYEKGKMEELNQRFDKEQQQLEELEDLRSQSSDSKDRDTETRGREIDEEKDDQYEPDMEPDNDDDYSR